VGMRLAPCGSVPARQPRAGTHGLPAGQGYGGAAARRRACPRPPSVSRSQRLGRRAWTSRPFLTGCACVCPLSPAVCAAGAWGRTRRRAGPAGAQGGPLAPRLLRGRWRLMPPPAGPPRRPRQSQRRRGAGPGPSGRGRGQRRGHAGRPAARGRGRASPEGLAPAPCRPGAPGPLDVRQVAQRPADRRADPHGGQGTVWGHGTPTRGPRLPSQPPRRHPGWACGLAGWHERLKLVTSHPRDIQER
jgi:hypothetical protein